MEDKKYILISDDSEMSSKPLELTEEEEKEIDRIIQKVIVDNIN